MASASIGLLGHFEAFLEYLSLETSSFILIQEADLIFARETHFNVFCILQSSCLEKA